MTNEPENNSLGNEALQSSYCQNLNELISRQTHLLKDVGDQWCTPDNIFWGINAMFGPLVLDLFSDGQNAKCAAFYTAEDNALTQDWSERLINLNGAAFANPPYSRATQHQEHYITGMRYIMQHASAMREKSGRYVFLIKAATSEVWWPEDADHVAFIRGRIGFDLPSWFTPADEKQIPSGAFFAGAIAVFDKNWRGPAMSYISRKDLEAQGDAFLVQIRREAEKLAGTMQPTTARTTVQEIKQSSSEEKTTTVDELPSTEAELPLSKTDIQKASYHTWACACAAFGDKELFTFSESKFAHTWIADSLDNPVLTVVPEKTIEKAKALIAANVELNVSTWVESKNLEHENIRRDMTERLLLILPEMNERYGLSAVEVLEMINTFPETSWHNARLIRVRIREEVERRVDGKEVAA